MPSNKEGGRGGIDYLLLTPLLYAPTLPLITRLPANVRHKVFGGVLATAVIHGYRLIGRTYTKR